MYVIKHYALYKREKNKNVSLITSCMSIPDLTAKFVSKDENEIYLLLLINFFYNYSMDFNSYN